MLVVLCHYRPTVACILFLILIEGNQNQKKTPIASHDGLSRNFVYLTMKKETQPRETVDAFEDQVFNQCVTMYGRILQNKLFDILNERKKQHVLKSVPSPSAQTKGQCSPDILPSTEVKSFNFSEGQRKLAGRQTMALVGLMSASGCRVSEALQVKVKDISLNGRVKITGSKGSYSRIVTIVEDRDYFIRCKHSCIDPFQGLDRFFVYRMFKKLGIVLTFKDSSRNAVTHAFRHLAIQDSQSISESIDTTQLYIGHKNIKSTQHYGSKKGTRV